MTGFLTFNRFKIKRLLNQVFDLISAKKFEEIPDILDLLKGELYKYCVLMDLDNFKDFADAIHWLRYDLRHYAFRSDLRQNSMRNYLKIIYDLLSEYESNLSLYNRVLLIAESLDHNLSSIFSSEGALFDDVVSDFQALQDLAPEIKELGFEPYQLYRQTMKTASATKSYLPLEKPDVRVLVKPSEVKDLRSKVAPFLACLSDFIAVFHQPPTPPKSKDKEGEVAEEKKAGVPGGALDVDQMKRQEIFLESSRLIQENWCWRDVCRHLNLTSRELLDIWNLDMIPTVEGDESTDESEDADESEEGTEENKEQEVKEKEEPADTKEKSKNNQSDIESDA